MLDRLKNLFAKRSGHTPPRQQPSLPKRGGHAAPKPDAQKVLRPNPKSVAAYEHLSGRIEDAGPGKNVLIRNKYVREDTGTHEKLKILDDSIIQSGEEQGIDPYNTGGFDRSRNWDRRFRK